MDRLVQLLRAAKLSINNNHSSYAIVSLEFSRDLRSAESLYQELSDLREHGWLPELSNKLPDTPPDCE